MEIFFQNKYAQVNIDKESKYTETIFFETTSSMTEEDYKAISLQEIEWLKEYKKYDIHLSLVDMRNFLFPIVPELQEWAAKLMPLLDYPENMKHAIVMSEDIFTQVSVEQTHEEIDSNCEKNSNTQYFDNIIDAKRWLFA